MWCTSCHSADEAGGTHFTTHEGACYICHFKGAEQGRSVTECSTCHTAPSEEVEHGGFKFNHQAYVQLGVSCDECHVRITRGNAEVDRGRCHDCHVERLGRFNDFAFMHDAHVAQRGISCFRCHDQIEHGSVEFISVLDVRCENCHSELHSPQKQMYMGVGGLGISDVPSRMFAAKVGCEGCHTGSVSDSTVSSSAGADIYEAKRQSCIRCHGAGYDLMLDDWIREMNSAMQFTSVAENRVRELLGTLDESRTRDSAAAAFLRDALANIELVRRGAGAHNVEYAVRLLNTSIDQIAVAHRQLDMQLALPDRPAVMAQPDGYCSSLCHNRLNTHGTEYFAEMEIDFDHLTHDFIACTNCHSVQKHKQEIISKGECMSCHHTEEGREYGVVCSDCHSAEAAFYDGSVSVAGVEIEPDIMSISDVSCIDCHSVEQGAETLRQVLDRCNSCHEEWGVEPMPVDEGFLSQEVSLRRQSDALIVRIERQRVALGQLTRIGRASEEMNRLIDEADSALNVVLRGRPHHNFPAAENILKKVSGILDRLEDLTSAAREAG